MLRFIPDGIDDRQSFASCAGECPGCLELAQKGGLTMFRHIHHAVVLLAVAVLLTLPGSAPAQVSTADIVGTVTDQAGAVITGAAVTAENTDTRERRTATTG